MPDNPQQIFLVGPNKLFNDLLARYISEQIGALCSSVATLCSVPAVTVSNPQKRLVLYDFSQSSNSLEGLIASDVNCILQKDYLVLINLSDTLNIECEALECGVRGFLYYQGGVDTLLEMIESVLKSEIWISRELMTKLLLEGRFSSAPKVQGHLPALTTQERKILHSLAMGLTNKKIADSYCLSPHTAKTHLYHIFKKIGATNRLQAVQWATLHLSRPR